jgi:Skp family chaperone for outer membrane proteins
MKTITKSNPTAVKAVSKVLFILSALLFSAHTFAQRGVRIAYVDMEYILENVEEYRGATEQLATKVEKWKVEIEQKQSVVEQMKKDLMAEKVLLTDELISEREEEIQILEKEMLEYQQARFGPQGDLVLQKRQLIQPIQDQVFNEVQKIGTNKKYDFIFDKSADVVMLYSQKRHDISDIILRGIARTRKVSAPKKKEQKSRLQDFEGEDQEEAISEALQERQDKAKEASEERTKTADEKRAEQLKLREERKKAYEERRKKLLEDREAKKKAKQDERTKITETEKDTIN